MDLIKLIVIVILIIAAVALASVVILNDMIPDGTKWFDRLGQRQQTVTGVEVEGSPMEVVTDLFWRPFGFLAGYEFAVPGVSLMAAAAGGALLILAAVLAFRWALKILGA